MAETHRCRRFVSGWCCSLSGIVLLLLLLPTAGAPQDIERMEQVIRSYVDARDFMGSVLVARDGELLLSAGYGFANAEWRQMNSPATKFRIGSITKFFTAAAILLLEDRRLLSTDDLLADHLPDTPDSWSDITLFHLLTHTAGLPDFYGYPEYQARALAGHVPEIIDFLKRQPLEFSPGERMSYSNSGYLLLGWLLEGITGDSYEDFLRENFFVPLDMHSSGHDAQARILRERAAGYVRGPGETGLANAPLLDQMLPNGSGGLYSTTEDLWKWTQGVFQGGVLSESSVSKLTTPFQNNYALGLNVVTKRNGALAFEHGGNIEGFTAVLTYYPEERVTVVVLGNLVGRGPREVADNLGLLAHGESVVLSSERQYISLSRAELEPFVGIYTFPTGANVLITLSGDHLYGQVGMAAPTPLFAEAQTRFHSEWFGTVEFEQATAGSATALVLERLGMRERAERLADRPRITLAADILIDYPGVYELEPGVTLDIGLEGDLLVAEMSGQGKVPVYAEAVDQFYFEISNVQLEFVRDADGQVIELIMRFGDQETGAVRR